MTTLEPGCPQETEKGETSKKMEENVSETLTTNRKIITETEEGSKAEKIHKMDKTTVADDQGQRSPHRPYVHLRTNKKFNEWKLTLKEKQVIIGYSNFSRIPSFD